MTFRPIEIIGFSLICISVIMLTIGACLLFQAIREEHRLRRFHAEGNRTIEEAPDGATWKGRR